MKPEQELMDLENEDKDFEYDEVRGEHGRKPKMAILNKTKLTKYEMDDLFTSEEVKEPISEEY
jgi:hypothetical protein